MENADQLNRPETPRADTRFRKGQSGNPRGRPRKVTPVDDPRPRYAEESMYEMVRGEAYRPVRVQSGDTPVEMSAIRAGLRAMSLKAAKGNRLALSSLMQLMAQTEAAEAKRAAAAPTARSMARRDEPAPEVAVAEEYKDVWSRVLVAAAKTGATLDPPVPHPDEVTIARVAGTVSWPGSVPGETLSLNPLAAKHSELSARLPELRRKIDALPFGHEKMVALCMWFEQDDLRCAIGRNLPGRYYVDPAADWRRQEIRRSEREWAQSERWRLEWEMAEALEEGEAEAVPAADEVVTAPRAEPGAVGAESETELPAEPANDPEPIIDGFAVEAAQPAAVVEARTYVRAWSVALAKAKEVGLPLPEPLLHPDDVLIDVRTGTVGYREPPKADGAATIEQAREGLAQLRRMVGQLAQDLAWTDDSELHLVRRKLEGARQVCAAMEAALGGGPS